MSATATLTDIWSDGKRTHVIGTIAFASSYATGGDTLDLSDSLSQLPPLWFEAPLYRGFFFEYAPTLLSTTGKLKAYDSGDAAATGTLTSDATAPADGDTVTIGTQVYTFKTALTAATTAFEVLIGASAAAALTNLKAAINLAAGGGTTYGSLTPANTKVVAGTLTATTLLLTALISGTVGNATATTETSAHLSFGAATLTGGVDPTAKFTELSAAAYPTDLASYSVPFYAIFDQLM